MMSESDDPRPRISAKQWTLIAIIVACAAGSLFYRLLTHQHLEQTAALFIGIPSVLAIVVALQPAAQTVTGTIIRGVTLALLIVAPLLGEGFICILFAAPLFYLVGIVVGLIADRAVRNRSTRLSCVAVVLLPMCLEGVIPALTFDRTQVVSVRKVVPASADAVQQRLGQSPDIALLLPAPLRIGFPRPIAATGSGLAPGSARTIRFSGAEGKPPGDLKMRITESRPGYLRFSAIQDGSKLAHWIAWDSSEVEWTPIDATHTAVTWRIQFDRELDPAWYFVPLERAAVHEAAAYLID
ncbi:MAG TPA: hypothetical protein VE218_14735, partial [Acidobacteriaceae bacterium]|nr:hypothetical protein [Acidobacteriaceae bacterium]